MPTASVRAFAEMIELPPYQLIAKLQAQKYPTKDPATYRIPYYREAIGAIRDFYRQGRLNKVLTDAIANIQNSTKMADQRKGPNIRLIRAFQNSTQPKRQLTVQTLQTFKYTLSGVMLRYRPDLLAKDKQRSAYILYNYRQAPITPDLAKRTLELAFLTLSNSGVNMTDIIVQFVDLALRRKVYTVQIVRSSTLRKAQQSAKAVAHLWQQI